MSVVCAGGWGRGEGAVGEGAREKGGREMGGEGGSEGWPSAQAR